MTHSALRATTRRHAAALAAVLLFAVAGHSPAQFSDAWIRNAYWGDGKAEFNIYDAKISRYGHLHPGEVMLIFVREPFNEQERVKAEDWQKPGVYHVLKLNHIRHFRTGIYLYQQMHSAFWRMDDSRLVKFSLTSNDSCGNSYKQAEQFPDGKWRYFFKTYWEGMAAGLEEFTRPEGGIFYDELPMRIRTIDWAKATGEFEIPLVPGVINSKKETLTFAPAKVAWRRAKDELRVKVTHTGGGDELTLEPEFPHLLRRWKMADGSELTLTRTLKIDYWNYHDPGDRERPFNTPGATLYPRGGAEE